ncbi:SDR family NAD(P)-dependent oxidoreductase [Tomitella fengzijianii]|uniref:SDR family NAD(P)-dependent oxidoreductase n=1 Tax=Tomitella fengzijianii TaxID=2597660 RepID=UPI0018EEE526|nr:SDR family NAD(P)-dependent oxidoreductase [Tomitella fengzijianii]
MLLGGCSDIGMQVALRVARAAAAAGDARTVVLAARRTEEPERRRALEANAVALRAAGAAAVAVREFDADDLPSHGGFVDAVTSEFGAPGVTVLAFGILGDQARAETDSAHAAAILHTDFVAQASVLTELTSVLRAAPARGGRRGSIIVFSSVAGVRVRRANYVYGSAKAGLDGFACGLSDALTGTGVDLLLARPGFVVGAMTVGLMADGVKPAPMSSTPDEVADAVVDALARRRRVVWIPGRLRAVFAVARLVPGFVWRRLPR